VLLDQLPLARATIDRDAISRQDPELVARMQSSPISRILIVDGGRVAVVNSDGQPALLLVPGAQFPTKYFTAPATQSAYMGADSEHSYLALDAAKSSDELLGLLKGDPRYANAGWASLREVGPLLTAEETGLVTGALALMQWHRRHQHCPLCGSITVSTESGWVRTCPVDRSQHFPRTDPAVIMAITDDDDRLLLGRGAAWPVRRFSTLAGFVEPGETPEAAVRREVFEEASIQVGEVEYRGSQPWPFPASLMLAYTGKALNTEIIVDGVEMLNARWFSRETLASEVAARKVILPTRASVARYLIEDWYGQSLQVPDEF